jgi:hypothetical protein
MILTNFYNRKPKVTSKIIIQLFIILSIADIIWIIYFSSAWIHLSEEERAKTKDDAGIGIFWDSLWFIHGFVYFLAFVELILKALLLYYLIMDYKGKYSLKDLMNFNYDGIGSTKEMPGEEIQVSNNISNDIGGFEKDIGDSFDENFQNNF